MQADLHNSLSSGKSNAASRLTESQIRFADVVGRILAERNKTLLEPGGSKFQGNLHTDPISQSARRRLA